MTLSAGLQLNNESPLFDTTGLSYQEFHSDPKQIRSYASQIVYQAPITIRELNLLEQQVSELVKNAIKHGNHNDPKKLIKLWYSFDEHFARLIVEDEGMGFRDIEAWNQFYQTRQSLLDTHGNTNLGKYVAWRPPTSDETDGGTALFAAIEFWNMGLVYSTTRNRVAAGRDYSALDT
jgi:hypothetical protein